MSVPVEQDLIAFQSHLVQLGEALDAERQALESHDVSALEQATLRKNTVLEALTTPNYGPALADRIDKLEANSRKKCEQLHSQCLAMTAQLRDSNLVNGKILNRSQNSLREIINILNGKRSDGLYGQSGQPALESQSGEAIAKA